MIIDGMPNAEYHAQPALGSTSLKILATQSPAHYKWSTTHSDHKPQFDFGSAAHSWILEGDRDQIAVVRAQNWLTKAAKEARNEARAEGKYPVLAREFAAIRLMRLNVLAHPVARLMVEPHSRIEASIFWDEGDVTMKCRPDSLNRHAIWDLKTTMSANPRDFGRTAHRYGYHQSADHYRRGVEAAGFGVMPFRFVLVEKTPPYAVSVVELDEDSLELGAELNTRAAFDWEVSNSLDKWEAYPEMVTTSVPAYAHYDIDDEDMEFTFSHGS